MYQVYFSDGISQFLFNRHDTWQEAYAEARRISRGGKANVFRGHRLLAVFRNAGRIV